MSEVVIPMFVMLATFIGVVWRSQAALGRRLDEEFRAIRAEMRADREERERDRRQFEAFRTETRENFNETNAKIDATNAKIDLNAAKTNAKIDLNAAKIDANGARIDANAARIDANAAEHREQLLLSRTENRENFSELTRQIEKVGDQVGSFTERVARVEGYVEAVSVGSG